MKLNEVKHQKKLVTQAKLVTKTYFDNNLIKPTKKLTQPKQNI